MYLSKKSISVLVVSCLTIISIFGLYAKQSNILIVHEWGTFTTKHRANGDVIGGLNRIDTNEVLPAFVHRLKSPEVRMFGKGLNLSHPDVSMKLETPVVYFYPPKGFDTKTKFSVDVKFRGGLLNEFYPQAKTRFENVTKKNNAESLSEATIGYLSWKDLVFDTAAIWPETNMPIWLAPRKVKATAVRASNGEAEKYLFYRGVAHLKSMLDTRFDADQNSYSIIASKRIAIPGKKALIIPQAWIVDVKKDGRAQFKSIGSINLADYKKKNIALSRDDSAYTKANLDQFRQLMKLALVKDGLYADEADAMLKTWKHAYFKNPGTRLMYVVPKAWTNYYLPMKISIPNKLTRVMIGRIDLLKY